MSEPPGLVAAEFPAREVIHALIRLAVEETYRRTRIGLIRCVTCQRSANERRESVNMRNGGLLLAKRIEGL